MAGTKGRTPTAPMDLIPDWAAVAPLVPSDDEDEPLLDADEDDDAAYPDDDEDEPTIIDPVQFMALHGGRLQVLADVTQSALVEAPV